MKSIFITTALLLSSIVFYSQIMPSSCQGDIEVEESYFLDAHVLALEHIYENELTYMDSINIPNEISDSIQGALMAVYNVEGIPERDSVVFINNLHTFPLYILNSVIIVADSTEPWIQDLSNDVFPTSEPILNDIMTTYGMSVVNTFALGATLLVEFETDQYYNVLALATLLEDVPNVIYSDPNGYIGDGNDIEVNLTESYTELNYSLGWGDCPAGCICRRHWIFKVYPDCSVEFINSYGCSLAPVGIDDHGSASFTVYPNPFDDKIILEDIKKGSSFTMNNQLGQRILEGTIHDHAIKNLDHILPGIYFLTIRSDHNQQTVKVVKK